MNLADAIRAAMAGESAVAAVNSSPIVKGEVKGVPKLETQEPTEVQAEAKVETPAEAKEVKKTTAKAPKPEASVSTDDQPEFVHQTVAHSNGNVVRIELFLHPEQMGNLMRAILHGQHTVLTLKEAATYLRVSQSALTRLAEAGEVPGVHIEGRWRFPKTNLDDWMAGQAAKELGDVA